MGYINKIQIDTNTAHLIEPTLYITPTLSNTAYSATLDNFELVSGVTVQAKFTVTNPASATLNINNTGNKAIYYAGASILADQFKVNHVYDLVYNGTGWEIIGDIDIINPETQYLWYATCDTAAATRAKVISIPGITELKAGISIRVKFTNAQTYNGQPQINLNSGGAVLIYMYGTTKAPRYAWRAGEIVDFIYDGTYWMMVDNGIADTNYYGITKLSESATSTSTSLAVSASGLNNFSAGMISNAPVYSTSATYAIGDRVRYNFSTWECNTAISTAEAWTAAHWTQLSPLQTQIDNLTPSSIGAADEEHTHILSEITDASDLQAIEALSGTSGLLKKTAANTWSLDTNTYSTTDENVKQVNDSSTSDSLPLLFANATGNSTVTSTIKKSDGKFWCKPYYDMLHSSKIHATKFYLSEHTSSFATGSNNYIEIAPVEGTVSGKYTASFQSKTGTIALTSDIPSVPSWALATNKPTYTASEVGALSSDTVVTNVSYTNTTSTNSEYPVLFKYSTGNTTTAAGVRFIYGTGKSVTINGSTGNLTAPKINGLTLTSATTGFTISGGTTSKTLTVGADYTLGAACAKGITDNSSNADVTSSDTNLITGRTLYYQLAKKGYTTNTGTVTSITIKTTSPLSGGSNTAVSDSGTWTIGFAKQSHNTVLAGPSGTSDADATPTFRSLVATDIPNLSWNKITSDKPTTLSGYGITDASASDHDHNTVYITAVGYDSTNKKIYYTKNGSNTDVVTFGSNAFNSTSYLPLSGGDMSGTINRYYSANSSEPIIKLSANNKDTLLFQIGYGTSAGTVSGNYYKLKYQGTGSSPEKCLQLIAAVSSSTEKVAIQINEEGNVIFPQMNLGSTTKPIYINDGVITEGTALKDLAYIDLPSSNTTTTFLCGDGTWQTAITAHQDLSAYATLASPIFTGTPKSVTPAADSDGTMIATKAYVDSHLSAADALVFQGTLSGGSTTTYTPAANCGDTYKIDNGGLINELPVETGDLLICLNDTVQADSSNVTSIRENWVIVQSNVDGAVYKGTTNFVDTHVIIADGTNGKVKDSGFTIETSVPSGAVFTDEKVTATADTANTFYLIGSSSSSTATGTMLKSKDIYYTSSNTSGSRYSWLILGNTTKTDSSGGREGRIRLYGNVATYYMNLVPATGLTANQTITFPGKTGTLVVGTTSTTANAIAKYSDTTATLANSAATIDDNGNITATSFIGDVTGDLTGNADTATLADYLGTRDTDTGSVTQPIYLDNGAATVCNTYAGGTAITLNGTSKTANTASFYASTDSGSQYQILVSDGMNKSPLWTTAAKIESKTSTSPNTSANTTLTLGNNKDVSSTDEHSEGKIELYSSGTKAHVIVGAKSTTNDYMHTFPNATGWIVTGGDGVSTGVASATKLMYLNANGVLTASGANIANNITLMYLEGGELKASGTGVDVGSNTCPVYLSNGTITTTTYSQSNRLYYTASASSFEPTGHYASTTKIGINISTEPSTNFYVEGTSYYNGLATHAGNIVPSTDNLYTFGDVNTRWTTGYFTTSLLVGPKETYITNTSKVAGSIIEVGKISTTNTNGNGGYYLYGVSGNNDAVLYGKLFINTIGSTSAAGEVQLTLGNNIESGSNNNSSGRIRIYSSGTTYTDIVSQSGYSHIYTLPNYDSDMYAVHVGSTSAVGAGNQPTYVAANGRITACDTVVGDAYTPVYSNAGVLTETSPVQYATWTISNGNYGVTITSEAYRENTFVISLVVTSGEENLQSPLRWQTSTNNGGTTGNVTISSLSQVTGAVSGYVITARGTDLNLANNAYSQIASQPST